MKNGFSQNINLGGKLPRKTNTKFEKKYGSPETTVKGESCKQEKKKFKNTKRFYVFREIENRMTFMHMKYDSTSIWLESSMDLIQVGKIGLGCDMLVGSAFIWNTLIKHLTNLLLVCMIRSFGMSSYLSCRIN